MDRRSFLGNLFGASAGVAVGGCRTAPCRGGDTPVAHDSRQFAYDHDTIVISHPLVKRAMRFSVITDSHFAIIDSRDDAYRENAKRMSQWSGREQDFDAALERSREWGAEIVILTGDIFSFPSYANIEFVERKMKSSGLKWAYVSGNHDWHFEGMPGTDNAQRAAWLPRLKPLYQGTDPLAYALTVGGIRFVLVDNTTYQLLPEQVDFLRKELATGAPTCLFMHIPFYMPTRPCLYTVGNPDWGEATDDIWMYEQRQKWAKDGQVRASFDLREAAFSASNMVGIFAGHTHVLQVGTENGVPQVVVPSANARNGRSLNVELRGVGA